MSTPDERTRALVQTGAFLKQVLHDPALPAALRAEAGRLLRHYPGISLIRRLALAPEPLPGDDVLGSEIDPQWLEGYPHGGHDP